MALLTNLIAHWKLNEASGTRADAHSNGLDLSETGSVPSTTGKIGDAADIPGSAGNYLTRASESLLQLGSIDASFAIALWVKFDALAGGGSFVTIFSKGAPANNANEYSLSQHDTNRFRLYVGTGVGTAVVTVQQTINTGQWYFVMGWRDAATNEVFLRVDGTTSSAVSSTLTIAAGVNALRVGVDSAGASRMNGQVDSVSLWIGGFPDSTDRDALYAGGAGLDYDFSGGSASIIADFLASGETLPTAALSSTANITPSVLSSGETLYTADLSNANGLTATLLTEAVTLYSGTISAFATLTGALLASGETLYTATLSAAATIEPGILSSGATLPTAALSLTSDQTITPALLGSGATLFTGNIDGYVDAIYPASNRWIPLNEFIDPLLSPGINQVWGTDAGGTKGYMPLSDAVHFTPPREKEFPASSSQWIWIHNLGFRPIVQLYDTTRKQIFAAVDQSSEDQIIVDHLSNQAGFIVIP